MNKLTIPAILAATVLVAGIFAFMPVEQASTVHTTGLFTFGAGSITAGTIAIGAVDADALATDAVTEITDAAEVQTGTSAISSGNVGGDVDVTVFDISGTTDIARGTICVIITDGGADTATGLVEVLAGGTVVTLINNANSEAGACASFATDRLVIQSPGEATGTDEIEFDASWVRDDA